MGNTYFIAPLIQEIEDDSTGVQGSVQGAVTAAVTLSNGSNTYTTYINSEGKFMIRGVEDGTYQIQVNAIASSNMQAQNGSMSNVVVTQGQITQVGNITLTP
jgi:osmotically-inducible protein OsmY